MAREPDQSESRGAARYYSCWLGLSALIHWLPGSTILYESARQLCISLHVSSARLCHKASRCNETRTDCQVRGAFMNGSPLFWKFTLRLHLWGTRINRSTEKRIKYSVQNRLWSNFMPTLVGLIICLEVQHLKSFSVLSYWVV